MTVATRRKYKSPPRYRDGGAVPVSVESAAKPDDDVNGVPGTDASPPMEDDNPVMAAVQTTIRAEGLHREAIRVRRELEQQGASERPQQLHQDAASIEQQISAMPVPDKAKEWLRGHPELITDPAQNNRLGAVHRYLTDAKGVAEFSPAYFEALDTELGFKKAPPATTSETTTQPQQRRSMPVTAPVSRDVPTTSGEFRMQNGVTLSPEERQVSHLSYRDVPPAEAERIYAIQKLKLQRERAAGRYPERERG